MLSQSKAIADAGFDAIAIKPGESELSNLRHVQSTTVVIDFDGAAHVPTPATLDRLDARHELRVTAPVRVEGFDPLGDHRCLERYPDTVEYAFVAGHPAYLDDRARRRPIAPRLGEAVRRYPEAWVGTEGIERIALATGATQYELLSATTRRHVRALRSAGFDGGIVVYAPTIISDEEDVALDAIGEYVARRKPVSRRLPAGAREDGTSSGRARRILLEAIDDHAIVGQPATVASTIQELRDVGVDMVVGYPAAGVT